MFWVALSFNFKARCFLECVPSADDNNKNIMDHLKLKTSIPNFLHEFKRKNYAAR